MTLLVKSEVIDKDKLFCWIYRLIHACMYSSCHTKNANCIFLDNENFRPLRFSVHSLQLLYFPASIAELAGESKSKIKPGKVYYYASIHDSQTFLRLLSPKKCWPSWTDPLSSPYAATLTKIAASRSPENNLHKGWMFNVIKNNIIISTTPYYPTQSRCPC
jgi:hypothetical protein